MVVISTKKDKIIDMIYKFNNNTEEFTVKDSHRYNNYFPLTNKSGSLLSSISPNLAGDIKRDNDHFLTPPATAIDLKYNPLVRRDFFIKINSASAKEKIIRLSDPYPDKLQAGFFYHKLTKYTKLIDIEILNFIPYNLDIEVMQIKIKNKSNKDLDISACSSIPLYGRSESTLRDHRHVSSLLNRINLTKNGILLRPTLLFNEEGHKLNQTTYFCLTKSSQVKIKGQFPTLDYFCGQGSLAKPDAIYKNKKSTKRKIKSFDGKEVIAAFEFEKKLLKKNQTTNYILGLGLISGPKDKCKKEITKLFTHINTEKKIKKSLEDTKKYWQQTFKKIEFNFTDKNYNCWLKWVKAQPTLRKLFGCSFLPHFDYGKGGRGWRDLWQDALILLHYEPREAFSLIINSFSGIRLDGSNATIIKKDNSFLSDRNKISRVWSDHGVWPYLTLESYLNYNADINILNHQLPYFRDSHLFRAKKIDYDFKQKDFLLRTTNKKIYKGNILEHLLIQNLTSFFNVGSHNIIKLESADWNDALDMADNYGETVAFSFMYAHNLKGIAELLKSLKKKQSKVKILKEITFLLDSLNNPINYNKFVQKQKRLKAYLKNTTQISGKTVEIPIDDIICDLDKKYKHLSSWLIKNEWLSQGFFNGYYDNAGKRVGGTDRKKIKMMLAPQVFAIMSGIATVDQIKKIWQSANKYLKDNNKSFRLNTNFGSIYPELGRAFGFKYGDKENGAFFSHMLIMFAYALYKRGFTKEGNLVFNSIYKMVKSNTNTTYPQLPEYFNNQGQGLYSYLTGSASWYIHTLLTKKH
ncbi:MAG: cellobiose phosphorylase [Candidatus Omnitrophica bacterium]|nr:cellobiose phosphorylase [Candidatus Omnitrophota bacterium]MCF7888130.1 cellobiose phosphorylase [Candidatus Omnitrophota bacterium]